jgi:hypothetical protein
LVINSVYTQTILSSCECILSAWCLFFYFWTCW